MYFQTINLIEFSIYIIIFIYWFWIIYFSEKIQPIEEIKTKETGFDLNCESAKEEMININQTDKNMAPKRRRNRTLFEKITINKIKKKWNLYFRNGFRAIYLCKRCWGSAIFRIFKKFIWQIIHKQNFHRHLLGKREPTRSRNLKFTNVQCGIWER